MMKNFTPSRFILAVLAGIFAFIFSMPVYAQYEDNPNLDQLPWYLRNTPPPQKDNTMSTVTTIGNWDNFNLGVDFGESNMAANPLNPIWLFTAYNTNTVHHTENGLTWADGSPSFGATMQGDPVVAYDSLGNLFYENMYGTTIAGVKVIKSTDNGSTWGTAVTAVAGVDKNWMACDQTNGPYANYVYVCMTANSGGNFARSTDHGATFTTTFTPATQAIPGMMVAVGPNGNIQGGNVFVVTDGGTTFAATYTFYKSTDGGLTFTQMSAQNWAGTVGTQLGGRHSVQNMRTRPYPMIAADNSYGTYRGRLYCVYATNDPPGNGNKPDIWCRYSTDAGATWSSAILINDDPSPQTHHQWHPAIWCDKQTGKLYAMWMDTRDCPTSDSALIYASYSTNGGVTWAANKAISNQKMKIDCPSCGGGGTPRYQGDYNGIISNKKVGMAGWTDFRSGTFMSTTAYFPDFAMSLNHNSDTLYVTNDSTDFIVGIPGVKLYSDTVLLTGQITPSTSPGSITFLYPQGSTITTYPATKIVRLKLSGNVPVGIYTAKFFAKGPNGTPAHERDATIHVLPATTLNVSVSATPSTVCSGSSTQLLATAAGGTGAITYQWTSVPPGFNSTIPNPTATPTVNTWYKCTVHDAALHTAKDSVYVTVNTIPGTPGAITGNTTACEGQTLNYSIAAVTGATTYTWTVPSGSSVVSGQGTTNVAVLFGSNSGNVAVTAGNTCGTSPASQVAVTVSPLPATPGPISGPSSVCEGATATYSIPPITGATITWTVPSGATITSGQGTLSITVQWGATGGIVSVTAQNSCGTSSPGTLPVTVETVPGAAQAITGPDTVCQGLGGYMYSIPVISGATAYLWTVPSGASISQGMGTNSIKVDFSATAVSGNITAAGNNTCGAGTASTKFVDVMVCSGIGTNPLLSKIAIYPNPAHGSLTVSIRGTEKQLRIRIMDLSGRCLFDESVKNLPADYTRQIDVSGFAKGLYMIKLTNDSRVFVGKFEVN